MKINSFFVAALLLVVNSSFAKGGCGGHCCGHGHGGGVAGVHCSSDDDVFRELRTKICNGYIVYRADTLRGIVVCADNTICIKLNPEQDSTYRYGIKDTCLASMVLSDNNKSIYITRLNDKRLYQVYHTGKLCVYDTWFSFDCHSKQFYNKDSRVMYDNHFENLNSFWTTSVKRKLVSDINKAYGLEHKPKEFRKKALLEYVSTLN